METTMLAAEFLDWDQWPQLEHSWADLVQRSHETSFFVGPDWTGTWLAEFGPSLRPTIVAFRDAQALVGACLLVRRTVRKGPFAIRRIYLNTSGEDELDSACVEFNALVCEDGRQLAVARALRDALEQLRRTDPWDELVVEGVVTGASLDALRDALSPWPCAATARPSHYVDLDALRASGKDYLGTLPSRLRTQLRQSARAYGEHGELLLDVAASTDEALRMLDELADLHQKAWNDRGMPGAFASPAFVRFHQGLIRRCFPLGQIQLLRLRAGEHAIGALYNFIADGKVYFYQSGCAYGPDRRLSPGMLVHAHAVGHAAAAGLHEYDLMAGDFDYKRKLAKQHRMLHWLEWQAPSVKMKAFEWLRRTRRKLRHVAAPPAEAAASERGA
jgi:CelD/BcsL family acetyltransferase involved in cellulose biosynthesis